MAPKQISETLTLALRRSVIPQRRGCSPLIAPTVRVLHKGSSLRLASGKREFAGRWRAFARRQRFDDLNELIDQHNEWYPVERNLPMDIRTRDFVLIHGRSYRRPVPDSARSGFLTAVRVATVARGSSRPEPG